MNLNYFLIKKQQEQMVKNERIKEENVKRIKNYAARISNDGTVFCGGQICQPKRYADWRIRCTRCFVWTIFKAIDEMYED